MSLALNPRAILPASSRLMVSLIPSLTLMTGITGTGTRLPGTA